MYSGSPTYSEPSGWINDAAVGGGYIESFAYGSIQKPGRAREVQMSDVTGSNGHGKRKSAEWQRVRVIWVSLGPHVNISRSQKQSDITPAAPGSCKEWLRKLSPETYEAIAHDRRVSEEFKNFPNHKVFFDNKGKSVVELTKRQVNALSQFTSYGVIENRELFLKALSGQ